MKYLIIGLGSMGKRRIRNLKALGEEKIAGYDIREDRLKEATDKYGLLIYDSLEKAINDFSPDIFIISVWPDKHMDYAFIGLENNIHCFIEASVGDEERVLALSEKAKKSDVFFMPSCTMRYYPGPREIRKILNEKVIGEVLNLNYHSGQYLPDWHPWEDINDYYVSNRLTGGCREIVPFELTWINEIFGTPNVIAAMKCKLTDIDADIDDIYHCLLIYNNKIICNLTVDVIARPKAVREMRILGTKGMIEWSDENNLLRYCNTKTKNWININLEKGTMEKNYIRPEEPYIRELSDFIDSVTSKNKKLFPNDLEEDYSILTILNEIEKKCEL